MCFIDEMFLNSGANIRKYFYLCSHLCRMRIRSKELLDKYAIKHASVKNALQRWIDYVQEVEWDSHYEKKV